MLCFFAIFTLKYNAVLIIYLHLYLKFLQKSHNFKFYNFSKQIFRLFTRFLKFFWIFSLKFFYFDRVCLFFIIKKKNFNCSKFFRFFIFLPLFYFRYWFPQQLFYFYRFYFNFHNLLFSLIFFWSFNFFVSINFCIFSLIFFFFVNFFLILSNFSIFINWSLLTLEPTGLWLWNQLVSDFGTN